MRSAIVGFVAGAALLQTQAELPEARLLAACLAIALLLRGLRPRRTAVVTGALLGFCWAAWLAHNALVPQLSARDEGVDIVLSGTIDSLPYQFADGVRFNFAVEHATGSAAPVPPRVSLAWYSGYRGHTGVVGDVQPGERWQLTVRSARTVTPTRTGSTTKCGCWSRACAPPAMCARMCATAGWTAL